MKTNDIIGLGSAIVDFLVQVGDDKLLEINLTKGQSHLVDEEKSKEILSKVLHPNLEIKKVSGGSSANCLKGFAFLGGSAILCGKVGNDEHGDFYVQEINNHGVIPRIGRHDKQTGNNLTLITPDAERTFSVHLGAALELYKEDILEEDVAKSKILHLEGYQVEGATRETIMHAVEFAKKHNTLISIDLADPGVIQRNKDFLKDLVINHADIVFVNELEAKEFTGLEEEEAAKELAKHAKIAIVKLGAKGSLICNEDKITIIQPFPANAIDTTGAGDCYAAGFLYGYTQGWSFSKAGKLGSLLSSKIVEQTGVKITELDVQDIKKTVDDKPISSTTKIGIIGGSGLDNPNILTDAITENVKTPYGDPSSNLKSGKISNVEVVLIARHGRQHTIPPTQVNNKANIYALKEAGCTHILATTACGSLKKEIERGDLIILDQFIDFTRRREVTFYDSFEPGNIKHTPMAEPFSKELRSQLNNACDELNLKHHKEGCVITIEGPRFSTKAESRMFHSWGADVINMSIAPEAILANELGIPYAAIAMSTDYDCLFDDVPPVSWKEILEVFGKNVDKVIKLITTVIPRIK